MQDSVFELSDNGEFYVTPEVKDSFDRHGFIIVRNLLNVEEVSKLRSYFENCRDFQDKAYGRSDGKGRKSKLVLWNKATDDVGGVVARYLLHFYTKLLGRWNLRKA